MARFHRLHRLGNWPRWRSWAALLVLGLAAHAPAGAWEASGTQTITAHTRDGGRVQLGTVRFDPQPDGWSTFQIRMTPGLLKDHFLSMKEFKCLEGDGEIACHVPYPYAHPARVNAQNLGWLEHQLLFLYKLPSDFGAKLWNGLYFQLNVTPTGLRGQAQAIDLNHISVPPSPLDIPPYAAQLRDDIQPNPRWIQSLSIE